MKSGLKETNWLGSKLSIFTNVRYCLCLNQKDFDNAFKSLNCNTRSPFDMEYADGSATLFDTPVGPRVIVSLNENVKEGIDVAAILVHEGVHVWQHIKEDMGEDKPSMEFEAYSIDTIFKDLALEYKQKMVKE